jgi:hypothetical protein
MTAVEQLTRHAGELTEATGVGVQIVEGHHPQAPGQPQIYVILNQVSIPSTRFRLTVTDILFLCDYMYPRSALDMFYTEVGVLLTDGRVPASAEVVETYAGRTWRRFSWHRGGSWNPAGNGLLDHYYFALQRFSEEP